ncbi:hypothetical protein CTA1_589 [Colletotrichum tanaceti]|uniref:Uncharacterized protein n=1 Tax=Colletotrichum tanaceti TaxID=1306861 RepID=A0A4U6X387_9PEZI|nr:hypothetical protein CTA1_589 [Colletotrichum tanaceti]
MPSYRPPRGCVSRWLPMAVIGAGDRSAPLLLPNMLPISSTESSQPRPAISSASQRLTRASSSDSARRAMPVSVGPLMNTKTEGDGVFS